MTRDDMTPLPRRVQWWRETKNQRQRALATFTSLASVLLVLALQAGGAILISLGVHQVYEPAGYVVGGLLCWVLQWSHEKDKGGSR